MDADLRELFDRQAGVVARRQLHEIGLDDSAIRRLVRRKELVRVHRGVYVNHTGPLSWLNRAWAAVLFHWPAALCAISAVNLSGDVIHVAVNARRTATRLPGIRVHRLSDFDTRVLWNLSPPRDRFEEAVLDVAAEAPTPSAALAVVADACQRRRTSPRRLSEALSRRTRTGHGSWLRRILADVEGGVLSVLEASYLHRVVRSHGLPSGRRQAHERTADGSVYRDVELEQYGLLIELDGRTHFEDLRTRWRDMDRDLLAAGSTKMTIRLGWIHCEEQACRTAARLAQVLVHRGWRGSPRRCGPKCTVDVDLQSPSDWNSTA